MPLPIHDRAVIEDGVDGMRCLRFEWMTRAFLHIHLNPSPGAVGTCQKPSTISIGPCTTSKYQGTAPTISSWITWFDVDTAKCSAATPAIGPIGLCGATPMPAASAMAAIFFVSHKPPQWQISGCAMLIAR
jgi:hypothetical protein